MALQRIVLEDINGGALAPETKAEYVYLNDKTSVSDKIKNIEEIELPDIRKTTDEIKNHVKGCDYVATLGNVIQQIGDSESKSSINLFSGESKPIKRLTKLFISKNLSSYEDFVEVFSHETGFFTQVLNISGRLIAKDSSGNIYGAQLKEEYITDGYNILFTTERKANTGVITSLTVTLPKELFGENGGSYKPSSLQHPEFIVFLELLVI